MWMRGRLHLFVNLFLGDDDTANFTGIKIMRFRFIVILTLALVVLLLGIYFVHCRAVVFHANTYTWAGKTIDVYSSGTRSNWRIVFDGISIRAHDYNGVAIKLGDSVLQIEDVNKDSLDLILKEFDLESWDFGFSSSDEVWRLIPRGKLLSTAPFGLGFRFKENKLSSFSYNLEYGKSEGQFPEIIVGGKVLKLPMSSSEPTKILGKPVKKEWSWRI